MNYFRRNEEIKKKSERMTYAKLSEEYGVSKTRISQICNRKTSVCKKHNTKFYTGCRECSYEREQSVTIEKYPSFKKRILKAKKTGRKENEVFEKKRLIRELFSKGFSVTAIARMLGKNHTTILHHLRGSKL